MITNHFEELEQLKSYLELCNKQKRELEINKLFARRGYVQKRLKEGWVYLNCIVDEDSYTDSSYYLVTEEAYQSFYPFINKQLGIELEAVGPWWEANKNDPEAIADLLLDFQDYVEDNYKDSIIHLEEVMG